MHRLPVMSSAHPPPPLPLHRSVLVLKFDFPSFQAEEEKEDANHHPVINQLWFGDGQGRQKMGDVSCSGIKWIADGMEKIFSERSLGHITLIWGGKEERVVGKFLSLWHSVPKRVHRKRSYSGYILSGNEWVYKTGSRRKG
ncbi:hypothetical protein NPIL_566081 [Nephila pilipes]|uniref:Uncharacterized protein n=1 Tax=Nephila pilipes TaxID=299642 RepID=A0A8X6R4B5_NEPPI|nr:hypothetical protein NPIL_566081 [Nephila pilipes]